MKKVAYLFEELYNLLEVNDTAVFRRCVFLDLFFPNDKLKKEDIDKFLSTHKFASKPNVDKVVFSLGDNTYPKYLDNYNSSEGKVFLELFKYLLDSYTELPKKLKECKDLFDSHSFLKQGPQTKFQYFPFFARYALRFPQGTDLPILSAGMKMIATGGREELKAIPEDFLKKVVIKKEHLGSYGVHSTKDLVERFDQMENFVKKNQSFLALSQISYKEFFLLAYPIVKIRDLFKAGDTPEVSGKTKLENGSVTPNKYKVHYCFSPKEIAKVTHEKKYTDWCVISRQVMFDSYTGGGFFCILLKEGYEQMKNLEHPKPMEDEFGLSMMAVAVGPEGDVKSVTGRRNDGEEFITEKQLAKVLGLKSVRELNLDDPYGGKQSGEPVYDEDVLVSATYVKSPFLKVKEGISKIKAGAFKGNQSIRKVVLPSTIKLVDDFAFDGCTHFEEMEIPDTGVSFGVGVFRRAGIRSVAIPQSTKRLGAYLFQECEKLVKAELNCHVASLTETFFGCKALEEVKIAHGREMSGTFKGCSKLKKVSLPEDLLTLETGVFEDCTSLTSLKIPDACMKLSYKVFSGSKLEHIVLPKGLNKLTAQTFSGLSTSCSVEVDPESPNVFIDKGLVVSKRRKEVLSILPSVTGTWELPTEYSGYSYFDRIKNIKKLIIPEAWSRLPAHFFGACPDLEEVVFKGKSAPILQMGTFCGCPKLRSITTEGDGILAMHGISDCPKLEKIDISDGFEYLSYNVHFKGGSSLPNPLVSKGGKLLFRLVSKKDEITRIPDGVERVGAYSLQVPLGVDSSVWSFPASVKRLVNGFRSDVIGTVNLLFDGKVPDRNEYGDLNVGKTNVFCQKKDWIESDFTFRGDEGVFLREGWELIEKAIYYKVDGGAAVAVFFGDKVMIPSKVSINGKKYPVVEIGESCFSGSSLSSITFPKTLKSVGDAAFSNTKNLKKLDFSKTNLESIGGGAFFDSAIEEISFSEVLKTIGTRAFYRVKKLQVLELPASLVEMDSDAFPADIEIGKVINHSKVKFKLPPKKVKESLECSYDEVFTKLYNLF